MKKALAWLLVIAMTAALAVGGTLAYLTDTDEDVNVMTVGKVRIDQLEYERVNTETTGDQADVQKFHNNKPLYPAVTEEGFDYTPGDTYVDWEQIGKDGYTSEIWDPSKINNEQDKMVFVKNKGDWDAYVRTVFAFEAGSYETLDEYLADVHLNLNDTDWTWEWAETPVTIGEGKYFVAVATYNEILEPGALTEISLSQVALDSSVTNDEVLGFGDTFQILVQSQAVQADGFADAPTALNDAFGVIVTNLGTEDAPVFGVDSEDVPFEDDNPIEGTDMKTALHYLNAGTTKITGEITRVVYGYLEDYPQIADNYDGILVDAEQDVDVNAYYVKDSNGYTVYFLSDDTIYAPTSCKSLFSGMKALTSLDVSNFDTSRVETTYAMFQNCQKLTSLDVSNWDTSKVTNSAGMFANCYVLSDLDTSGWDFSNNTSLYFMFQRCYALETLDVSNWGMENVTTLEGAFAYCSGLKTLDMSEWDVSNVTTLLDMFKFCSTLESIDASGWNTSKVTNTRRMFFENFELETVDGITDWDMPLNEDLYYMFQRCYALKSLDLSGWNLSEVEVALGLFFECTGLEYVNVSGWDTGKITDMSYMFYNCAALKDIVGIGQWDVGEVTAMSQMFRNCLELETLDVADWRPGKVTQFDSMFSDFESNAGRMKLKNIDVSQWDVSSATNMKWMFYGCGQLTDLDLSGWDVSNVESMYHMFADCFKMQNYNFSGWNTASLTDLDGIFNSNLALVTVDVSDFDTGKVTDFSQCFDGATSLENIIGLDKWDTSSGLYFEEFLLNTKVKVIDLSSFDMSSAVDVKNMFHINPELTTIYASDKWNLNLDNLSSTGGAINGSPKLVGGNGTTYSSSDASYLRIDTEETPGYLTYKATA